MKFMTSLGFSEPLHYAELARTADAAGWDYLGLSDHVVFPERLESKYPYSEGGDPGFEQSTPWPDPWVAIGAMATVTEHIRFVTNIYQLPLRHPLHVAKAVSTAAYLAHGRVVLGAGVGWMREEFDIVGEDFRTRGRRCDEALDVLKAVWSGETVSHEGEFYSFPRLCMQPAPERPIPIYIGGTSDPALRRAARIGDGWISALHDFEDLRGLLAKLEAFRKEAGTADAPFEIIVACNECSDVDGYRRLEEIGATAVQTMPWLLYGGSSESLDDKRAGIERFASEVIEKMP